MRRILRRRPSPALVVATIALFLAAGGTTYALTLPANSVGSAQIQAGRVLNSKLAPGSVSNSKMGRNAVTFSKLASNQMTAAKIRNGSLLGEDLAANTVTGAQIDEATLAITRFAVVDATGALGAQSTGVTVANHTGNTTIVDLGTGVSVSGRPIAATLAGTVPGQIVASPCGVESPSNPNGVTCAAPYTTAQYVQVKTFDKTGAETALPFSVSIPSV
jgi:hypothetical protein